jgi:hypothetical protein
MVRIHVPPAESLRTIGPARSDSAAGPKARGARCPSAADQSSVFNRHIPLVDWAVDRSLRRSYCSAAIALSSAPPLCASAGLTVLFRSSTRCAFHSGHALGGAQGQAGLTRLASPLDRHDSPPPCSAPAAPDPRL